MIVYLLVFCLVGDSLWTDCCCQHAVLQCLIGPDPDEKELLSPARCVANNLAYLCKALLFHFPNRVILFLSWAAAVGSPVLKL